MRSGDDADPFPPRPTATSRGSGAGDAPGSGPTGPSRAPLLTGRLALPAGIFLASRLVTLAVAHAARVLEPQPLADVLSRWDGAHYLSIVTDGYPAALPGGPGTTGTTVHAFFPGYPLLVRAVTSVTGLAPVTSAVAVNMVMATVAVVLVWLLARDLAGEEVATRSVTLLSFFPGAFVLGMAYSEGTFLALAAACLLALQRRHWAIAGLAAAAAGATRPPGLILAVCCAWAALVAVRRRREWRALVAPGLAPLGFVAWSVFLERRTGSALAWKRSQEQGWGQGFDLGANTARAVWRFVSSPLAGFNLAVCVLAIGVVMAGVALLWRWRPPVELAIYTTGILLPALASAVLTSTARFALTAFPLHVAFARALSGTAYAVVLALSASAMALLMLVASLSLQLTP